MAAFSSTNGLDPTVFPSLLQMENELVGRACDLLDAPGSTVPSMVSATTAWGPISSPSHR